MKLDDNFTAAVHTELLHLLAGEDSRLGAPTPDTLALAGALVGFARSEAAGDPLSSGRHLAGLDHRSRLIVATANLETKGAAVRVARLVECFGRALSAALRAVEAEG